jgi:hypothetical protein
MAFDHYSHEQGQIDDIHQADHPFISPEFVGNATHHQHGGKTGPHVGQLFIKIALGVLREVQHIETNGY